MTPQSPHLVVLGIFDNGMLHGIKMTEVLYYGYDLRNTLTWLPLTGDLPRAVIWLTNDQKLNQ